LSVFSYPRNGACSLQVTSIKWVSVGLNFHQVSVCLFLSLPNSKPGFNHISSKMTNHTRQNKKLCSFKMFCRLRSNER
jgi:hypothetical protein